MAGEWREQLPPRPALSALPPSVRQSVPRRLLGWGRSDRFGPPRLAPGWEEPPPVGPSVPPSGRPRVRPDPAPRGLGAGGRPRGWGASGRTTTGGTVGSGPLAHPGRPPGGAELPISACSASSSRACTPRPIRPRKLPLRGPSRPPDQESLSSEPPPQYYCQNLLQTPPWIPRVPTWLPAPQSSALPSGWPPGGSPWGLPPLPWGTPAGGSGVVAWKWGEAEKARWPSGSYCSLAPRSPSGLLGEDGLPPASWSPCSIFLTFRNTTEVRPCLQRTHLPQVRALGAWEGRGSLLLMPLPLFLHSPPPHLLSNKLVIDISNLTIKELISLIRQESLQMHI